MALLWGQLVVRERRLRAPWWHGVVVAVARRRSVAAVHRRRADGAVGGAGADCVSRARAARMAYGGARRSGCGSAACRRVAWNRRARVRSGDGVKREKKEKQRPATRARNIYDKWARDFS